MVNVPFVYIFITLYLVVITPKNIRQGLFLEVGESGGIVVGTKIGLDVTGLYYSAALKLC